VIGISPGPGRGCTVGPRPPARACTGAGACLGRRGSRRRKSGGAGEGRGRAPAGERPPVRDGPRGRHRCEGKGAGSWGTQARGQEGLVAAEERKSEGLAATRHATGVAAR